VHQAVFHNKGYIKFSRANCVEVMAMQDIPRALAEKPARAATYKAKDPYGDEIECFVNFPGVTVGQMKDLIEGEALNYMEGPLMPYMGVVDPHSLKTIGRVKRGEPYTAKHFIAAIEPAVKALEKKHGKGVDRKVWRGVKERQVRVDILLGGEKIDKAMDVLREMRKLTGDRPADVLQRRLDATRDVILEDAAARLDSLEAMLGKGEAKKTRSELTGLAQALKDTKLAERAGKLLAAARKG